MELCVKKFCGFYVFSPFPTAGKDADENSENSVYPKDHVVRVGEGIVFCCILKQYSVAEFTSPAFKIQISNRTFATEPIYRSVASPGTGFDVSCGGTGSTYFVGCKYSTV